MLLLSPCLAVAVGSCNPCKLTAVTDAFSTVLSSLPAPPQRSEPQTEPTFHTYSAPSGVPDQPMGDAETLLGAKNRALAAASMHLEAAGAPAHFSVGLEGGIVDDGDTMWCMAYMAVYAPSTQAFGVARTAAFALPPLMARLVREGVELGVADDIVTRRENSKQGEGTVGVLSNGAIPRGEYYRHALVLALSQWAAGDVYFKGVAENGEVDEGEVERLLAEHKSKAP